MVNSHRVSSRHCQTWGRASSVTCLTRLWLDAVLQAPPPPRKPGSRGRPRRVGARLPSLPTVLADFAPRGVTHTFPTRSRRTAHSRRIGTAPFSLSPSQTRSRCVGFWLGASSLEEGKGTGGLISTPCWCGWGREVPARGTGCRLRPERSRVRFSNRVAGGSALAGRWVTSRQPIGFPGGCTGSVMRCQVLLPHRGKHPDAPAHG